MLSLHCCGLHAVTAYSAAACMLTLPAVYHYLYHCLLPLYATAAACELSLPASMLLHACINAAACMLSLHKCCGLHTITACATAAACMLSLHCCGLHAVTAYSAAACMRSLPAAATAAATAAADGGGCGACHVNICRRNG